MPKTILQYQHYETILKAYLQLEEFANLSDLTINQKRIAITQLMNYLGDNGVYSFSDCIQRYITNHIDQISNLTHSTISGRLFIFRHFFNHLYQEGITNYSGNELFPVIFTNKRERILSFYSVEEVKRVISEIDRKKISGKRDLAIILLASELGMRSSDIRRLTMSDLHWERNTIEFIQYKTKIFLQLPLPENVRYALIDYIKNARPTCACTNVFVGTRNGYTQFSNTCIHSFVSKYFKKARIDISERKHGPHALRHSLASNLMHNNTPMHVIKDVLGHTNLNTTRIYLNIDLDTLKQISLEVPYETIW